METESRSAPIPPDAADPPDGPPVAPPVAPPPREGPDLPFLFALGIAAVAALVLVRNLLPVRRDLEETLRREERLQEETEALRAERDLLRAREEALEKDPAAVERSLRAQTGMTRPGEFIVR